MPPAVSEETPLIGQAPPFMDLMDRVSRLAPLNRPVLIIGERGTGKELISRRLHFLSDRWDQTFVQLNCAALPDTLLESELFGYEPGAFTGAAGRRAGRFEQADGGTLFLDEIANLSLTAQEKLLRIIEYGTFERLGGSETLRVDVRIVGATNVDLPSAAREGRFRADLLDRLAFDVLNVPPLRRRQEDILLLADHFARAMTIEIGWPDYSGFSEAAQKALTDYHWPGNVRELKNVVERAAYAWPEPDAPIDAITFDPFESPYRPEGGNKPTAAAPAASQESGERDADASPHRFPMDYRENVAAFEKDILSQAMEAHRFHQRDTAKALGLSYDQLRHALKKHGLL